MPFIPKLKSFLYDKNLEDKVFQKSFDFAKFEKIKYYGTYLNEKDNLYWIHYLDENNKYYNEILKQEHCRMIDYERPNQRNMLGIHC